MKTVLYNKGGHVAYVSVKIDTEDSFDAFGVAANIAHKHGGQLEALYCDSKFGLRTRIGGVEKAGLVLEVGTLNERDELAREVNRLRGGIEDYMLWDPRRAGHAEAHRKLHALVRQASNQDSGRDK